MDYSDDEGEDVTQEVPEVVQAAKPKKHIPYSRVSSASALKNILFATESAATQKEITQELTQAKQSGRKIEFDTVSGKRTFELEKPRERVWKGKQEREPYYYTTMREIYKHKLNREDQEEEMEATPEQEQIQVEMVNGKREVVKTVNQDNLVQFDYLKYIEEKERKDLLLEDKIKHIRGPTSNIDANHSKLGTKAYELLEKEAAQEVSGIKEEGIKRNKKQYGF